MKWQAKIGGAFFVLLWAGMAITAMAQSRQPNDHPSKLPPADNLPGAPALVPLTLPGEAAANAEMQAPAPMPVAKPVQPKAATPAVVDEANLGPSQQPDNPTGRQEPAVSIEWVGPAQARVGRPCDYSIVVRNTSNEAVQQVMVRVRIPAGMAVTATEPKAFAEGNVLMWECGTMMAKQDKSLQLRIMPDGRGLLGCQAWVTFTGSTAMRVKVTEPKLILKAAAPEKVMIGDAATFVLTVTNPGDGQAEQVKIHAVLSDGLEHPRGHSIDYDVGNLAPSESRSVQLICGTKAGGDQRCEAVAEAEGDLRAQDHCGTTVIMPRLDVEVAGPKLRYLDRKATYTIRVTNPGDAPATNVTLNDVIPAGFKFAQASDGGRHDFSTRTVSWFVGELGPAQTKEVKLELVAITVGEYHHRVSALAARGLHADADYLTTIDGLSALMLEVVDTEDPIEVGADTTYEIRITNTGTKTETEVKLVCSIPDKMQFKGATGPMPFHEQGKEIVFDVVPKLAPRADAIYRINVKGLVPGDVRFKAQLTSTNLVEPVIEMESTRIYED